MGVLLLKKMKPPRLILSNKISPKWLETCHEKMDRQLLKSSKFLQDTNRSYDNQILVIGHHDFYLESLNTMTEKYAGLVKVILVQTGCAGVWKRFLIDGVTLTGVRIYGTDVNIKLAITIFNFIFNGFERYYDAHVRELRNKRHNRRQRGIKLPFEVDARKRTNQNLANKAETLTKLILSHTEAHSIQRSEVVEHFIFSYEKFDLKRFKGMQTPTIKSAKARLGKIQLNRII